MADIRAILIFEMLGRPAEHLKQTLSEFIEKLGKEEGIEIKNQKINEPKLIEQAQQELYTSFAEIEAEIKDVPSLFKTIFVYMPSHIEIISPEELRIKNFDFNTLANELVRKLHQYDEIAKRLAIERNILQKQLQEAGIQPFQPGTPSPQTPQAEPKQAETKKKVKKTGKKKAKTKKRKKK